jgi:hypothetical protein
VGKNPVAQSRISAFSFFGELNITLLDFSTPKTNQLSPNKPFSWRQLNETAVAIPAA